MKISEKSYQAKQAGTSKTTLKKQTGEPVSPEPQHPYGVTQENKPALMMIENCVDRDLNNLRGVNLLQAFVAISLGLNLIAAKAIIRHGLFSVWLEKTIAGRMAGRTARGYLKLADAFSRFQRERAENKLELPKAQDAGMWLIRQDPNNSDLALAVKEFAQDLTITELMEKHDARPRKEKGGFRPNNYSVTIYCREHPALEPDYTKWSVEEQRTYRAWASEQQSASGTAINQDAATSVWERLKSEVDYQLGRGSYAYLTQENLDSLLTMFEGGAAKIKAAISDKPA